MLTKQVNGQTITLSADEEAKVRAEWAVADARREVAMKNFYKEQRTKEYPSIQEQLDMIWDAMENGDIAPIKAFLEHIKPVRDKFPKPEGV